LLFPFWQTRDAGWLAGSFPVEQANRRNYIFSSGEAELQPLAAPCTESECTNC